MLGASGLFWKSRPLPRKVKCWWEGWRGWECGDESRGGEECPVGGDVSAGVGGVNGGEVVMMKK